MNPELARLTNRGLYERAQNTRRGQTVAGLTEVAGAGMVLTGGVWAAIKALNIGKWLMAETALLLSAYGGPIAVGIIGLITIGLGGFTSRRMRDNMEDIAAEAQARTAAAA